jgi:hypothetical protein
MLTINSQSGTGGGSYSVVVTAVSGDITETISFFVALINPASFTLTPNAASLSVAAAGTSAATITVNPSPGFTGSVALQCAVSGGPQGAVNPPTCSIPASAAVTGNAASATLTVKTQATTSPGTYTVTIAGVSGSITAATAVDALVPAPASFTLSSNSAITIATAGASGTATIILSPSGGFAGNVALSCAVSGGPAGAADAPTCSIPASEAITGTAPVTATLTVNTTAMPSTASGDIPELTKRFKGIGAAGGGIAMSALLLFLPVHRRKRRRLLHVILFTVIGGAAVGCGGGKNSPAGKVNPGTTPGNYTVTVTGSGGSVVTTIKVNVVLN